GQLQVVVATHSPNLSAWVANRKLVFFRSYMPDAVVADTGTPSAASAPLQPRRVTRCIPLDALALNEVERHKVDRYLDVTKSALLFGGRVLLAEGIAEG